VVSVIGERCHGVGGAFDDEVSFRTREKNEDENGKGPMLHRCTPDPFFSPRLAEFGQKRSEGEKPGPVATVTT